MKNLRNNKLKKKKEEKVEDLGEEDLN